METNRVAVVIDEWEISRVALVNTLTKMSEMEGWRIIGAADKKEGLKAIDENQPALVFCDSYMLEKDGLEELLGVIKTVKLNHPQTKFIVMGDFPSIYIAEPLLKAGVDAFLNKPPYLLQLISFVRLAVR